MFLFLLITFLQKILTYIVFRIDIELRRKQNYVTMTNKAKTNNKFLGN